MTTPVYITSAAAWIPPAESAKEAVASGKYTADDYALNNMVCLPVGTDEVSVPDMTVLAARRALDRATNVVGDHVDMIVHASVYHQGRDYCWTTGPYIQRELGITGAFAVNVQQLSNGGMVAVDLAAAQLQTGRAKSALVTTADRFCEPGFDRWRGAYGIVVGDGATALVLSTTSGFARINEIQSLTDASVEQLHRGSDPFTTTPQPVVTDLRAPKKSWLEVVGKEYVLERCEEALLTIVRSVLDKTGQELGDFAKILMPNMGHGLMQMQFLKPLGITPERTLMDWGRYTGHLGAGDLSAGLARLVEKKDVRPGDHVLVIGAGGGYSLTVASIQIESVPDWPEATTDFALPADVTE